MQASSSYTSSRAQPGPSKKRARSASRGSNVVYASQVKTGASGYVDVASANYAFDTTGSITLLNTVTQGTAVTQRVGKKIKLKSLQCRGLMTNNSAATWNDVAFLIVYDRRPRGALPAITDILTSVSARAMNNDNFSGRFQILKRSDEMLIGNATALTECTAKSVDFYMELKAPTVYEAAGTGAINDIEQGALYLVTVGNAAAGTGAAVLTCGFRLRFTDILG